MDREAWRAAIHGVAKSWARPSDWTELRLPEFTLDTLRESKTNLFVPKQDYCFMAGQWQFKSQPLSEFSILLEITCISRNREEKGE